MGQSISKSGPYTKGQWEWKSNPDPFSQTEEAQWTPYDHLENYLLEKAFYEKENEVDLGVRDLVVSIKDMLQKTKGNAYKQRPVRRISNDPATDPKKEENVRSKRFFGAETPKTFNKAFGNLQDYLRFFKNRGPEIRDFAALFNDIETTENLDLLNKLVQPCIINCLQNESRKVPETPQKKQAETQLLQLFQEDVKTLKGFYAKVLKAYTIESFLYRNINNYLRNENWIQLDPLLPYAYCLCKAFLRQEFTSLNSEPAGTPSMIVYRGAQFDQITLSFYDPSQVKNFCWNGVTSTSRNRKVSENFMFYNFDPDKHPVLFIIEVPLLGFGNTSTWIDIKPYSAIPNEDEVVLPPGSVFELVNVINSQNSVEIKLKLMVNVNELAYQGQIMHGAMSAEMGNDTNLALVCLEGRELAEAITHLKGNRLIEGLEFCLCKFSDQMTGVSLEKIRRLKALSFISSFAGNEAHWDVLLKHLEKAPIEELDISDENFNDKTLHILSQVMHSWTSLKRLSLKFTGSTKISEAGWNILSAHGMKNLTSLTSLTLNFGFCKQITDQGLMTLSSQALQHLTSLTYLSLNFNDSREITDEGLGSLSTDGLAHLKSLKSFTLKICQCSKITRVGLDLLGSQGLKSLTSLKSLEIEFGDSYAVAEEGMNNFCSNGLKYLTSLTHLTLDFDDSYISDEEFNSLSSNGLKYLTSLTHLTLIFSWCEYFTDQALNYLSAEGLKYLTSLQSLSLDFSASSTITDQGLIQLCSQGLKYLTSLTSLNLKFSSCELITDEGLKYMSSEGLKELTSLTNLNLNFQGCQQMTKEGENNIRRFAKLYNPVATGGNRWVEKTCFVRNLKNAESILAPILANNTISLKTKDDFQKLTENMLIVESERAFTEIKAISGLIQVHASSLISLDLGFSWVEEMAGEELKNLSLQGLKILTSLTLDFSERLYRTDEGLNYLTQELRQLISLQSLTLNFRRCKQITDEGLNHLATQGLKYLTSLTELTLNFSACEKILDKGPNYFEFKNNAELAYLSKVWRPREQITNETTNWACTEMHKILTSMTPVALRSDESGNNITDEGLKNLSLQGIKPLASLKSLALDFGGCKQITDQGLSYVSTVAPKKLTSLALEFLACQGITDQGFIFLSTVALKKFSSLRSLKLDFSFSNITDAGLNCLGFEGLGFLTSLESLILNFDSCSNIKNEGFKNLISQKLMSLTKLTSLNLDFSCCKGITDEELKYLSCQTLKHLPLLTSLTLDLYSCGGITDEGLNALTSQAIKNLTALTSLTLNLEGNNIQGDAWSNFCKILKYFGYTNKKTGI